MKVGMGAGASVPKDGALVCVCECVCVRSIVCVCSFVCVWVGVHVVHDHEGTMTCVVP